MIAGHLKWIVMELIQHHEFMVILMNQDEMKYGHVQINCKVHDDI